MAEPRRALLLSTGRDRGALTAARALAAAGWFVGVGTPDGDGMAAVSRACDARHVVPRPRRDGSDFLRGVRAAVTEGAYDVVFGGGDEWMAALSHYRRSIPVQVAHPPSDVVDTALDKVRLAELAAAAGLAAAVTVLATDAALDDWEGPVVVKCRTHWSPGQTRPHRIDARWYPDAAAARSRVALIRRAGAEPILQVPVEGGLGALVGLFHQGRLEGRVQQVSPRLWPTPYGASSRAESVTVDESLAARAEDLLARLGWHGLVELQFLTGADGVPHLTDLNGRFYGSLALAEAARPGLVDAWGRAVLGEALAPLPDGRPGVRYAWTAGDLHRARVERRGGLAADVLRTLHWGARARHTVWDARDPRPTWHLASARLRPASSRTRVAAGARAADAPVPVPGSAVPGRTDRVPQQPVVDDVRERRRGSAA